MCAARLFAKYLFFVCGVFSHNQDSINFLIPLRLKMEQGVVARHAKRPLPDAGGRGIRAC